MKVAEAIILRSGEGRSYSLGKMTALFKADEGETDSRYCVSEWWMEPGTEGVGAHSHEANDEVFYVLEGAPGILIGEEWQQFGAGDFIRIPATITHDFRNRTDERAGLLNFFIPGGFESSMPAIVDWFDKNPS